MTYMNMAFGLRLRKTPKDQKLTDSVKMLSKYSGYREASATETESYCPVVQREQRVAMGPCIVRDPKVFIMDEPFIQLGCKTPFADAYRDF